MPVVLRDLRDSVVRSAVAFAGLVVAAFGGFVFALHLRRWLLERRARRHQETGHA